jgi:hypothetical protein
MLNHKCDVYHIHRSNASPGYNLPSSPSFSYSDVPDIAELTCHFNVKSGALSIVQVEPQANYEAKIKLVVPLGTDIRLNDKIVNCETGYEYTADIPVKIRNHHMYVMIRRIASQEAL